MNNKFNDLIEEMNLEQAKTILKNVLRKVPDSSQDIVLEIINDTMNKKDIDFKSMSEDEINIKMNFFEEKFNLIRDEELYLRCSWEEDYDDYWSGNGEWYYYDDDCIGIIINDAYDFGVNLVNMKRYEDASKVFDLIFYTKYWAIDEDGGDSIAPSLKEMKENNLIDIDVDELYLYIIYSNYLANKKEDRAKVIYEYLKTREFESVNIIDAFKLGLEVIDNERDFWNDLLIILSNTEGNREYSLIIKALEAMEEPFVYLYKLPEVIYKTHPKLFLDYLKELENDGEVLEIVDNGDKILERIDDKLTVRSDIALVIARANMVMGNDYHKYFLECFKSDSNCINLLRIILEDGCFDKYKDDIIKIINNNCSSINDNYNLPTELRKNVINENNYRLLNFFLGNFEDTIDYLKNNKTYLGWSSDFIRTCVDLFLLYLYDGDTPTVSINRVTSNLFSVINFHNKEIKLFDDSIFDGDILCPYFEIYRRWKQKFIIDDKIRKEILLLLKNIINERVEAIVGNSYRHSYFKAALLIVAYADIISVHDIEEGNKFIEYYKTKHSRKTAFRKELKELM